jgi:anti-anti-sigma factor
MVMTIEKKKNTVFVRGHCIVDDADQVRQELLDLEGKIANGGRIELDLSELEEIDSAGLQLLVAFVKALKKRKVAVEVTRIDGNLSALLKLCGLNKFFKLA